MLDVGVCGESKSNTVDRSDEMDYKQGWRKCVDIDGDLFDCFRQRQCLITRALWLVLFGVDNEQ